MQQDYFEEIVEYILANQNKLYRLAYSSVQNEQDAMDVVQNTICKALENAAGLRNINAVKTWIYRILMNESMTFLRKNRKELLLEEPLDEEMCVCDPEYADQEDLYERIQGLPTVVQNIIRLRFYEELSLQEIAEALELNLNTVKAKLYRGLKALRVEMEG